MAPTTDKEQRFMQAIMNYAGVIKRVCLMYSSPSAPFEDLYQESLANMWRGFDSFRGDAKMSTWIYKATLNTCVTWHRRNHRHQGALSLDYIMETIADDYDPDYSRDLARMYQMISGLDSVEKAIIMMWLDGNSYDTIADVTGLNRGLVATRLHRIKSKLKDKSRK